MSDSTRLEGMTRAMKSLEALYLQATQTPAFDYKNVAFPILGLTDLLYKRWTGSTGTVDDALAITQQSLDLLSGRIPSEKWGNLWEASLNDDDGAFSAWCDLADETGKTLSSAIGLENKWGLDTFLNRVGGNIKSEVVDAQNALPSVNSLSVLVIAVVVLILVVKFS